jgi:hypothetical protein
VVGSCKNLGEKEREGGSGQREDKRGGGCKTKREKGGSARVGGRKGGLPSVRSRSTAQTRSHVCAPDPSVQVKKSSTVSLRYAS